jgi:hypothetical protein
MAVLNPGCSPDPTTAVRNQNEEKKWEEETRSSSRNWIHHRLADSTHTGGTLEKVIEKVQVLY